MTPIVVFAREQLRTPFTLALLVVIPALFVISAASVLSDFAGILGGSLASDAAVALSAGWAAAFVAGTLAFFEAASSRGADRRLALAGSGPWRVALARIAASVTLALVAALAAFVALAARSGTPHPAHVAAGIVAFALVYVGVGVLVGSVVSGPLEGSLLVAFVFLLDAFSGPGMASDPPPWAVSQNAAQVLIAAGGGAESPQGDWLALIATVVISLAAALTVFVLASRSRS